MIDKEVLKKLNDRKDWEEIIIKLKTFAVKRIARLMWYKGKDNLPKGFTPADIAEEAIKKVFLGERRWDYQTQPDLFEYLKSTVNSLISNLVKSKEHLIGIGRPLEEIFGKNDPPSRDDENHVELDEIKLVEKLHECAKGDDDLEIVFLALKDGKKPKEIAYEYGVEIKDVYNLIRKLKRCVRAAKFKLEDFYLEA